MLYEKARLIAIDAGNKLKPFCEIIHIAGSLRRISGSRHKNTSQVKDIELICVPRYNESSVVDLFGASTRVKDISENFTSTVKTIGKAVKGTPDGKYMQITHRAGIMIDLFMPDPVDFYRQYTIRTGSVLYIQQTVAPAWVRLGWCGTDHGLRRISDCKSAVSGNGKKTWSIVNPNGERPPAWESEESFFEWLKLPYIHPLFRTI